VAANGVSGRRPGSQTDDGSRRRAANADRYRGDVAVGRKAGLHGLRRNDGSDIDGPEFRKSLPVILEKGLPEIAICDRIIG
jgi:hypothetical protein